MLEKEKMIQNKLQA
jgi:hypothetical protein